MACVSGVLSGCVSLCYRYKLNIRALQGDGYLQSFTRHKSNLTFLPRITFGAMPLVLLSLHIYFYQTTSYSQSAAGFFLGSLEKKNKFCQHTVCPIQLQIQSEKGHTNLIFPVCNEQWWSRHQNSRISSFYFFFQGQLGGIYIHFGLETLEVLLCLSCSDWDLIWCMHGWMDG